MIHERDRMARRADKWWRSVWHVQMLMRGRDEPLSKAKPLTDDVGRGFLKAQSPTKTKRNHMSDGPTDTEGDQHGLPERDVSHI